MILHYVLDLPDSSAFSMAIGEVAGFVVLCLPAVVIGALTELFS